MACIAMRLWQHAAGISSSKPWRCIDKSRLRVRAPSRVMHHRPTGRNHAQASARHSASSLIPAVCRCCQYTWMHETCTALGVLRVLDEV